MKATSALHVIDQTERAALALDPLRLRMLQELVQPDSATGLARRLGMPRQKLNYHLRLLEQEGLIEVVEERKKRNLTERIVRTVAHSYLINPAALGSLAADPSRVGDRTSSAYLVAAAARVIQEVAGLRDQADAVGKQLPTLTLQADIRFATPADQQAFAEELAAQVARLVAKFHDDQAADGRRFRFISGAYPAPSEEKAT
jgi:DNA-binding transcriptional ArsR family regulator